MSNFLLEDNLSENRSIVKDLRKTIKTADMINDEIASANDINGVDVMSQNPFLSVIAKNRFTTDLDNKLDLQGDEDFINKKTEKEKKTDISKAIDYINAEINSIKDESIGSLIQGSYVDKNRINKYYEIDNLSKTVTDLEIIVSTYTNAILNGDRIRKFPFELDDTANKEDEQILKIMKILDKIVVDHDLNFKLAKVIEDSVRYGDGFLLVSQISDYMLKTLSNTSKEIMDNDLLDDVVSPAGKSDTSGLTMRSRRRTLNESVNGEYILNDEYDNLNINNEDIDALRSYLVYLNTSNVPSTSNLNGIKVSKLKLPKDNNTFINETVDYYTNSNIIQFGGGIDNFFKDNDFNIVSEDVGLDVFNKDTNVLTENGNIDDKYVNSIINEASVDNLSDSEAKKKLLENMAKKSKRLKGSIIKRLDPYSVIKLMTGDNFCVGYLYIKQEIKDSDASNFKYTKDQKGTYGALGDIPSNTLNITGSPSEGLALTDAGANGFGSNGNGNNIPNYFMKATNDTTTLGKVIKTISKVLLSTIKLPEGIDKLDDETFINIYKMIDIKKRNKLYFFKPDDIHHFIINPNDDGYGDGLIGTSLVNQAKICLLLDRLKINNQIDRIPRKTLRLYAPDGSNPSDLMSAARKMLSKTPILNALSTGNVSFIDSTISAYGNMISPIVNGDTSLMEMVDKPQFVNDIDQDFIDGEYNKLRKLSLTPFSAFDVESGGDGPKVISLLATESGFAKEVDRHQRGLNPPGSNALKHAELNELLTYNQLINISKTLSKSYKDGVDNDIKEIKKSNDTLAQALAPLKNDLKNISSDTTVKEAFSVFDKFNDKGILQSQLKDDEDKNEDIEDDLKKDDENQLSESDDLSNDEFIKLAYKINSLNYILASPSTLEFQTYGQFYEIIAENAAKMAETEYPTDLDDMEMVDQILPDDAKLDKNKVKRILLKNVLIKKKLGDINGYDIHKVRGMVDDEYDVLIQNLIDNYTIQTPAAGAGGFDASADGGMGDPSMDAAMGGDAGAAAPDASGGAEDPQTAELDAAAKDM